MDYVVHQPAMVGNTSIGAINAAIITGNDIHSRLDCLREFWKRIERKPLWGATRRSVIWLGTPRLTS
jgi:predicted acylesterase/phospholipase RssA